MSLNEVFETVTFSGADELELDEDGLPAVVEDDPDELDDEESAAPSE